MDGSTPPSTKRFDYPTFATATAPSESSSEGINRELQELHQSLEYASSLDDTNIHQESLPALDSSSGSDDYTNASPAPVPVSQPVPYWLDFSLFDGVTISDPHSRTPV